MPVRLPAKKAPGTIRNFILGSSAAMGDPEPSCSLARVLDVMLRTSYRIAGVCGVDRVGAATSELESLAARCPYQLFEVLMDSSRGSG